MLRGADLATFCNHRYRTRCCFVCLTYVSLYFPPPPRFILAHRLPFRRCWCSRWYRRTGTRKNKPRVSRGRFCTESLALLPISKRRRVSEARLLMHASRTWRGPYFYTFLNWHPFLFQKNIPCFFLFFFSRKKGFFKAVVKLAIFLAHFCFFLHPRSISNKTPSLCSFMSSLFATCFWWTRREAFFFAFVVDVSFVRLFVQF